MSCVYVCVGMLSSATSSSSFRPCRYLTEYIFLIPKCRHGGGSEKHSHKLPWTQRWQTHTHTHTHRQSERTYRPLTVWWVFVVVSDFYNFIFLFSYLSRAQSSSLGHMHGGWRWMGNMSSKRRQRRRRRNEEIKCKTRASHRLSRHRVKVKSYELRKEWFVHKLGRRLNGIQLLSHKNKTKRKTWKNGIGITSDNVEVLRFFSFSPRCSFVSHISRN